MKIFSIKTCRYIKKVSQRNRAANVTVSAG